MVAAEIQSQVRAFGCKFSGFWPTRPRSLGGEDPLEKEMAAHSSILAWRIPMDRGEWRATVRGVARVGHHLVTKPPITNESEILEV